MNKYIKRMRDRRHTPVSNLPCSGRGIFSQGSKTYGGFVSICDYGPFGVKFNKALILTKTQHSEPTSSESLRRFSSSSPFAPRFSAPYATPGILLTAS